MGRRADYKDFPSEFHNSRHLKRWDTDPARQDTPSDYKRDIQRAVQDVQLAETHAGFDESAKDNHMRYERPQFTVTGEGTKKAQDAYLEGYQKIDWSK